MVTKNVRKAVVGMSVIAWTALGILAWRFQPTPKPANSIDDVRLVMYHAENDPKSGSSLIDPVLVPGSIKQLHRPYLVVALGYCQSCSTRQFNVKSIPSRFRGRILGVAEGEPSPIFVVGMPRSGTTLVEQILASHPNVTGMGELTEFQKLLDDLIFPLPQDGCLPISREKFEKLGSRYLSSVTPLSCGSPNVVDKMPGNFFFLGFIVNALPNSRIIHVRRDPVDTCISIYSKLFAGTQGYSYDLSELGRYYGYYRQITDHWRKILPARNLLEVEYEAVVQNTEQEVRRMLEFLELPWDDACLQPHKAGTLVMTASVFQVRQPIYKTSIGKREAYLPYLDPLVAALNPS